MCRSIPSIFLNNLDPNAIWIHAFHLTHEVAGYTIRPTVQCLQQQQKHSR